MIPQAMAPWQVALTLIVLLLIAAEMGFRFGHRHHKATNDPTRSQMGTIEGAILGLLGLLLGFTFAMAVSRYDHRKELVLEEANAIGTTYLRASLLPEPQSTTIKDLLARYVDVRLDFYRAGSDPRQLADSLDRATALQQ